MNVRFLPLWIFLFCVLVINSTNAQRLQHVQGDLIIQMEEAADLAKFVQQQSQFATKNTQFKSVRALVPDMNIWLFHFDYVNINERHFKQHLFRQDEVKVIQYNHLIAYRAIPNDPLFANQWQYINDGSEGGVEGADIDMDLAWDYTTGGVTVHGDTIVSCIIDDGLDVNHPDMAPNLWQNHAEIPGNDIDDDKNGYVDDVHGWDTYNNSPNISQGGWHGTPVAGIVGAKGNNEVGVAGVNWDVKLMIVRGGGNEANALASYAYPYYFRKLYNETNGTEGAFVVSTNASWGTDFGQPEDAPLWCAFYDSLGTVGVLNCGATINGNQNVDEVGDLPTACPSDFMISVTNMNRSDIKVTGAGYGATTIDLGAFGAETFTAAIGSNYGGFGGTSGATPHVTGTVALLYSANCTNLIDLAKANPEAAARQVRQVILDGVDPNESLEEITVTGGRLNVNNSMELLISNCGPCPPPFSLDAGVTEGINAELTWISQDSSTSNELQWRAIGDSIWNTMLDATSPILLTDLASCTAYEFQVASICADTMSDFSNAFTFDTETTPNNLSVKVVNDTTIRINWEVDSLILNDVLLQVIDENGTLAISDTLSSEEQLLGMTFYSTLVPCTEYTFQLVSVCNAMMIEDIVAQTLGCGLCIDALYCESYSQNATEEWIEGISIGNYVNTSGAEGGYAFNEDLAWELAIGTTYLIGLAPGFGGAPFPEYFQIFIDLNGDGEFGTDEQVYDAGETTEGILIDEMTIPASATLGDTRMRVIMSWEQPAGICEEAYEYGETEDYCIALVENNMPCIEPSNLDVSVIDTTFAGLMWDAVSDAQDYLVQYRELNSGNDWIPTSSGVNGITLENLEECTFYEARIRTFCDATFSSYTDTISFQTICIIDAIEDVALPSNWMIYPNPFNQQLNLTIDLDQSSELKVEILDVNAKQIFNQKYDRLSSGVHQLQLSDTEQWGSGIYFIRINTDERTYVSRVVKH